MRLLHVLMLSSLVWGLLGSQEPPATTVAEGDVPQVMEYDYTLQFASMDLNLGTPRSPYDERANRCLYALPTDTGATTVGGIGLAYGPCAHYPTIDKSGQPVGSTEKPGDELLWNFFEDGRLRNKQNGWCIRRMNCGGEDIYDLGPCDQPVAAIFNVWKARANRADVQEYIGLPLKAVDNPCSLCGPFIVKQMCGTQETAVSCGDRIIPAGWTQKRVMLRPRKEEQPYTTAFGPTLNPICGTSVQATPKPSYTDAAIGAADAIPPWYYFHKYQDGKLVD